MHIDTSLAHCWLYNDLVSKTILIDFRKGIPLRKNQKLVCFCALI